MPEWLVTLLGALGFSHAWEAAKRVAAWLRPVGLSHGKPLLFTIGEIAYIASHPYVPEGEVRDIIVQINLGNPDASRPETVMTFRLEVSGKASYPVSEARRSERTILWHLVPAGGGFSTVPTKDYTRLPVTIPAGGAVVGWIGFCLAERLDLTLSEAKHMEAKVVAVQADGMESSYRLPPCDLLYEA